MPRFTKTGLLGAELNGFDEERTLQVLQVGHKSAIYLLDGADLAVQVQNGSTNQGLTVVDVEEVAADKLSRHEAQRKVRKFVLRGKDLGWTKLTAPGTVPLTVAVVKDGYARLFGDGNGTAVTAPLVKTLKAMGLRAAAIRVAEDQMDSRMGRTGQGAGLYMAGKDDNDQFYDWCGGFAQWCYQKGAELIGVDNPFGNTPWALASPERAISWAMAHSDQATVIRYQGANTFQPGKLYGAKGTRPEQQDFIDLGSDSWGLPANVIPGDICLVHKENGGWKHVCIVYDVNTDTFDTIDGNQGYPSIKINRGRKFSDKVAGKQYRFAFLHLSLPPIDDAAGWMAETGA